FQTAVIAAEPDTVIELPAGKFDFSDEIVIRGSHLTVRGQGMDKTILSFRNQLNGAQGILATGDTLAFEDLAVEDTPGDGLKIAGANGVTVRRVRVEWTGGPNPANGSYALYPVQSKNVLIEDCVARGASDAGVYVGQSTKIIVRRNLAELNVAGIEIENSRQADVYDNVATRNTGGILVFNLPDLLVKNGGGTRVFRNRIENNNTKNFAPAGNIVGGVPAGTGMMVMANRDIEVFDNRITGQNVATVAIVSYLTSELPLNDPAYDPIPKRINVHDNVLEKANGFHLDFGAKLNVLVNALFFPKRIPEILYDGIGENYNGARGLPDEDKICFSGNTTTKGKAARWANLQLDKKHWYSPFPGIVLKNPAANRCVHVPVAAVELDAPLPVPAHFPPLPPEVVATICNAPGSQPNWAALLAADCPSLSQYRLFADATDPTRAPNGGVPYDLTTPLFSDYATKHRFVFVPPQQKAQYVADDAFDFPVGTVIAKTFGFGIPERVVETRLLVRRPDGWVGLPYLWAENRRDAALSLGGGATDVSFVSAVGKPIRTRYAIPSANQCASCHAVSGETSLEPIGPKARLLNRDFAYDDGTYNQLVAWSKLGILAGAPDNPAEAPRLPAWDKPADAPVAARARAYLEVNCAHCHSATGLARNTGVFLEASVTDRTKLGVCKTPVAAGIGAGKNLYDVVPGKPKKSIMIYRLGATHAKIKMPQIGRSVVHDEGLELVKEWIKGLDGSCAGRRGD
ncbi:MAG: right-handed parallel beta-helix repeat-containing protein, partial [Deltaproteobacteria bacterium]|nr:right-handed parallel beta-helix repeat-containing protein [Deltaproteobacteria bacterium]